MKTISLPRWAWVFSLCMGALLAGCSTSPKTLYQWDSYQPQVYEYFKGTSQDAQIGKLEADLEKIRASGGMQPPGYYAHLGMLYANQGDDAQMVQQFQAEKALFPESAGYIDFLQRNLKK